MYGLNLLPSNLCRNSCAIFASEDPVCHIVSQERQIGGHAMRRCGCLIPSLIFVSELGTRYSETSFRLL